MSKAVIALPVACKNATAAAMQAARWALPAEMLQRRDAVLTFWFGSDFKTTPAENFDLWFGGSKETDTVITAKFKDDVERAFRGEYHAWANHEPQSLLALIILLDQFPMNVYRDDKEHQGGYAHSQMAVPLAYTAIGREWVEQVPRAMRMFFTMPLMHSEKADDLGVLVNRSGGEDEFAQQHFAVVADHGRFPGRNEVMGRESNDTEKKYLAEGGVF